MLLKKQNYGFIRFPVANVVDAAAAGVVAAAAVDVHGVAAVGVVSPAVA